MRIPFDRRLSFYFVGIGGIGMSALAYLMAEAGYRVGGSDKRADFATRGYLEEAGVEIFTGHNSANIRRGWNVCVYSSAIPVDNPELKEARIMGLRVFHRSELLGELTRVNRTIGVTGAHGKTTTTAMIAYILKRAGKNPSVVLGSTHPSLEGGNARLGGDILVAEIDESDGSMLNTHPYYPVITSVDREHLNNYGGSYENLLNAMKEYAMSSGSKVVVLNIGYRDLAEMAESLKVLGYKVITYGLDIAGADVSGVLVGESPDLALNINGHMLRLFPPLRYNYENALAALAVAQLVGVNFEDAVRILSDFALPGRRFEKVGEVWGWQVYHDYAHHPREIEALISSAREVFGEDYGIWVVFQPHRYSRFCNHYYEFVRLLATMPADKVFVMPVYSAGESPLGGCPTVWDLVNDVNRLGGIERCYLLTFDDAERLGKMMKTNSPGILMLVGAGDVYKLWDRLCKCSK